MTTLLFVVMVVGVAWAIAWAIVECKRVNGPTVDHVAEILRSASEPTWRSESSFDPTNDNATRIAMGLPVEPPRS